ncbi:MAG: adenylate cyclase protein, partial [Geminicoccaceae bacterium]|nr:adenylate cyclase protein [Geminicoccaceae bacterium]
ALAAAVAARNALAVANRARLAAGAAALDFGVALDVGRVVYGNIGGQGRLDFTVIGPAVNLVSRIEGLCKVLGQPLLATAALGRHVGGELVPIGAHPIRGLAEPVELFALPAAVAPARRSA